jgi:hypothetical protein
MLAGRTVPKNRGSGYEVIVTEDERVRNMSLSKKKGGSRKSKSLKHSASGSLRLPSIQAAAQVPEDDSDERANKVRKSLSMAALREDAKVLKKKQMKDMMVHLRAQEREFYSVQKQRASMVGLSKYTKKQAKAHHLKGLINGVIETNAHSRLLHGPPTDDVPEANATFAVIAKDSMLAQNNMFDEYSLDSDDQSLGDTSLGDYSLGSTAQSVGSLGEYSTVTHMESERVTTNVLMAKAMERFNKRKAAFERKQQNTEAIANVLIKKLKERHERPLKLKKARAIVEMKQKWMAAIVLAQYTKRLHHKFEGMKAYKRQSKDEHRAANFLQKQISKLRSQKLWDKYMQFYALVEKTRWIFQMAIRRWRRKKATRIMVQFLIENKDRNQMTVFVSRFLAKIRRVQRFVKSFLACHYQRIEMLKVIWDDVELKYAKKLEGRMKEARKMKKLVVAEKSHVDRNAVKEFNNTCELWQAMDSKMDALLQSEREKKHLPSNAGSSLGLKSVKPAEAKKALCWLLSEKRKEHVKNIQAMYDRLQAERKKRAMAKNSTEDATRILGLDKIGSDNVQKEDGRKAVVEKDVPLFLFWTSFKDAKGLGLRKAVEDEFQRTYTKLYGDPIQMWKDKMKKLAVAKETPAATPKVKSRGRRYGVSVEVQQEKISVLGVNSEALDVTAKDENEHEKYERERSKDSVLSLIKKKRHNAEAEGIKARESVKLKRQQRHKKDGVNMSGPSNQKLRDALTKG